VDYAVAAPSSPNEGSASPSAATARVRPPSASAAQEAARLSDRLTIADSEHQGRTSTSDGADLGPGPGIQGVEDGEFELELALIVDVEHREAVGDGEQAG
jgi:hypothetical protein